MWGVWTVRPLELSKGEMWIGGTLSSKMKGEICALENPQGIITKAINTKEPLVILILETRSINVFPQFPQAKEAYSKRTSNFEDPLTIKWDKTTNSSEESDTCKPKTHSWEDSLDTWTTQRTWDRQIITVSTIMQASPTVLEIRDKTKETLVMGIPSKDQTLVVMIPVIWAE